MSGFSVTQSGNDFVVVLQNENESLKQEVQRLTRELEAERSKGRLGPPAEITNPEIMALADGSYDARN